MYIIKYDKVKWEGVKQCETISEKKNLQHILLF